MDKVDITECGKYFDDSDGPCRFRVEWRCGNQSGVEYFPTLHEVYMFEGRIHREIPDGEPAELLIDTPESYRRRELEFLQERNKVYEERKNAMGWQTRCLEAEAALEIANQRLALVRKAMGD